MNAYLANLVEAARAIVRARDYFAVQCRYDETDFHPEADQCFDDWAADILETALNAELEGKPGGPVPVDIADNFKGAVQRVKPDWSKDRK